MSPQQIKKLEKLAKVLDGGDVELLTQLDKLEDKVEKEIQDLQSVVTDALAIAEQTKKLEGKKGEKGDKGEDYVLTEKDKKEIAQSIKVPIVEKVIEKTEVIKEVPLVTNNVTNEIVKETVEVAVLDDATVAYLEDEIKRVEEKIPEVVKQRETNFGRVIREVQAGSGISVDSEDPNRPIVSAPGGLFDKPDGPLVILVFGDSNTDGIGGSDATLLTQNSNVHVYATTGSGTWNPADLRWRDVNPNAALVSDYLTLPAGEPYVGILRNANGSMGYSMADRLQQRTGRDVYLIVIHQGGKTTEYYQPGGGAGKEGMTAIETHLPTALASIPGSPTRVDYVMISIGGNDANLGITDDDFVTNWEATYAHLISEGYIEEGYTQTFQMEMPLSFGPYSGGTWRGYEMLSNRQPPDVHFLASAGYDTSDTVHYVPAAMNSLGKISADIALLGNSRDKLVSPFLTANDADVVKLTGDQTIAGIKTFSGGIITEDLLVDSTLFGKVVIDKSFGAPFLALFDATAAAQPSMSFLPAPFAAFFSLPSAGFLMGPGGATAPDVALIRASAGTYEIRGDGATLANRGNLVTERMRYNAGSPEGVITAPVGSTCQDTTNGVLYVKATGTGNTGWALSAVDSQVVKLTGDQTIAGVKTFTSQIAAPGMLTSSGANGSLISGNLFGFPGTYISNNSADTQAAISVVPKGLASLFGLTEASLMAGVGGVTAADVALNRTAVGEFSVWGGGGSFGTLGNLVTQRIRYNAGSPESVITAPVGSICQDTTNGVVYVKVTGTGSTGWKVLSVGGSDTQVQFNDSGVFGGDSNFTFNKTTDLLTVGRLKLPGQTAAYTTSYPTAWVDLTDNHTWSFSGLFDITAILTPAVNYGGTQTITASPFILGSGFLFWSHPTIEAGFSGAINSFYTTVAQIIFDAKSYTVTNVQVEFFSSPTMKATSGGTFTSSSLSHFVARGSVDTGGTITLRHGFLAENVTKAGSGAVTHSVGFIADSQTSGGTTNVNFLMGSAAGAIGSASGGNYNVYQIDTYVNRWAGGQRFSTRSISAITTLDNRDHYVELTGTGTYTVTLPAAASNTGRVLYFTKVSATGTVTIDGNASETINGATTYTMTGTAYQCTAIWCDGTEWFRII